MADRYCRNCGHELGETDRFCPNCASLVQEVAHVPTPEADVPVPPPPQQQAGGAAPSTLQQGAAPTQGRSTAGKLLVGCTGVFGVLVVLIVALSALGGGGDETGGGGDSQQAQDSGQGQQEQQEQQPEQQKQQGQGQQQEQQQEQQQPEQGNQQANESQEDVYSIGEVAKVGDVSYTVTNAERVKQLNDPYGIDPPLRGNFIVVTFIFKNNGDQPATVSDIGMYLYDDQGREFETDTDAAFYLPQDKSLYLLDRVNPGLSKEMQTVYSVPPDAKGFELEVTSGFFASESARIKLGF